MMMNFEYNSLMCDLERHKSNISDQEALDKRLFRWDRVGPSRNATCTSRLEDPRHNTLCRKGC
jgi:hypothetical protein